MKNTLETRLGIFAAMGIIAAVVILEMVGGMEMFKRGYRVHALFKNVYDLKLGDHVKMAGVPIGKVEGLKITNSMVRVTMKLNQGSVVRTDSKASIRFAGLMGQNFVLVDFGSDKGAAASTDCYLETVEQPDINSLMAKLDGIAGGVENMVKSFSGDRIDNLLGPFTDFLKQNREPLTLMIGNLKLVSDNLAQGKGTVGRLLQEDALYVAGLGALTNLEATASDVRALMGDARGVVLNAQSVVTNVNGIINQVNAGRGTLGLLLTDQKLYTETTDAMSNLREILQKVNRGDGSVGKLVNDDSLIKNAKLTLQKLDKATEGLEDQGPLSVLGMMVNSVF